MPSYLTRHKTFHSTDRQLKCTIDGCSHTALRKSDLIYHELTAHPDAYPDIPWMECSHTGCQYRTKYKHNMKSHGLTHKKTVVCDQCGHTFATLSHLRTHLPTHDQSLRYRCEWPGCDQTFVKKRSLKDHTNTHTAKTVYRCHWPGCEESFLIKGRLDRHVIKHKGLPNERFECQWPECDKTFYSKVYLKAHMNTHTGETVYRCHWPGCEQSFPFRSYLRYHEKRHRGIPVGGFLCHWPDCDYRTTNKLVLNKHVLTTHEGVSDVQCSEVVSKRKTNECNLMDRRVKRPKK